MNVNKIENKLKRLGNFYHDNKNNEAFTFKHKRTKEKFVWTKAETYYEFLQRCYNLLNGETVKVQSFCDLYKKECIGGFCSVTPFADKCKHLNKQNE